MQESRLDVNNNKPKRNTTKLPAHHIEESAAQMPTAFLNGATNLQCWRKLRRNLNFRTRYRRCNDPRLRSLPVLRRLASRRKQNLFGQDFLP